MAAVMNKLAWQQWWRILAQRQVMAVWHSGTGRSGGCIDLACVDGGLFVTGWCQKELLALPAVPKLCEASVYVEGVIDLAIDRWGGGDGYIGRERRPRNRETTKTIKLVVICYITCYGSKNNRIDLGWLSRCRQPPTWPFFCLQQIWTSPFSKEADCCHINIRYVHTRVLLYQLNSWSLSHRYNEYQKRNYGGLKQK